MTLAERFHEGGLFMWFILVFFVFTIGFIAERATALFVRYKQAPSDFRNKILAYLSRGDFAGAENYANSTAGHTSIGRIAALGCHIRGNAGGEEEVQARMDEKLASELSTIDRRTGFLAMFGNVATLLGLLGTIVGMITSFASVAAANPGDRATMLSQGIAEALNCTAFGLLTAIPALITFAIFQNRTDRIVSEVTETTTEIYHDLMFLSESEREGRTGLGAKSSSASTAAATPALEV